MARSRLGCGKNWGEEFQALPQSGNRIRDNKVVDVKRRLDELGPITTDREIIRFFFTDSQDYDSPSPCEEVIEFCRGVQLSDLKEGIGRPGHLRTVWIDEKQSDELSGPGESTGLEKIETVTGLYRILDEQVLGYHSLCKEDKLTS